MKKLTRNVLSGLSMVALLTVVSCGSPNGEEVNVVEVDTAVVEVPVVEDVTVVETDLITVHEDGFSHQHAADITEAKKHEGHDHGDEGHAMPQKLVLAKGDSAVTTADIESYMQSRSFKPVKVEDPEVLAIPTESDQTLMAFDKDANFEGQVQVVSSNETGEVTSIVFTGKHHVDEYNVSAGLTGKEARQLRRELKHMTKDGRIFLYEEGSNITYLMDSKDLVTGEEITQDDINNMVIEGVIWQK
jgi:hypothetical protein